LHAIALLVLATLIALTACGRLGPEEEAACAIPETAPVSIKKLISVFRSHGISLDFNERSCRGSPGGYSPTVTNAGRSGLESDDSVSREQGNILCLVGTFDGDAVVSQVRYPTDRETHLDALNIQCSVYPYNEASESRQVVRVRRALEQVISDVRANRG